MPAVDMVAVSKTCRRRGRPPQKALDDLDLFVEDLFVESGGVHGLTSPRLRVLGEPSAPGHGAQARGRPWVGTSAARIAPRTPLT